MTANHSGRHGSAMSDISYNRVLKVDGDRERSRVKKERRKAYRVTVMPRSDLAAAVTISERTWQAVPGNVSTEGVFLTLEPDAPVDLKTGTPLEVEITYSEETLLLHGVIRSRRARGYGIFFPKKTDDDYINPLDKLGQVWAGLQREILATRLTHRAE